jgi:hypothetical protein
MLGFRVWDGANMHIADGDDYLLSGDGDVYACDGYLGFERKKYLIPMQSTGVTDCNGDMIFEGDILQLSYYGTAHTQKMVVKDTVDFIQFEYNSASHQGVDALKIIGNKYQNPELLER